MRNHSVNLPVRRACVVTFGDDERFFEHEGKRWPHILDHAPVSLHRVHQRLRGRVVLWCCGAVVLSSRWAGGR